MVDFALMRAFDRRTALLRPHPVPLRLVSELA